jgi:hypothetical protein
MAILYALVARGTVVLAEHSAAATNAGAIARQVLERLPDGGADSHVSYTQDRYVFHAKRTDGITALCMADDSAGSKRSLLSLPSRYDRTRTGGFRARLGCLRSSCCYEITWSGAIGRRSSGDPGLILGFVVTRPSGLLLAAGCPPLTADRRGLVDQDKLTSSRLDFSVACQMASMG